MSAPGAPQSEVLEQLADTLSEHLTDEQREAIFAGAVALRSVELARRQDEPTGKLGPPRH